MLKTILSKDPKKLDRQIAALKIELENTDLSEKDRLIFKDTLKEMENQRGTLAD